MNDISTPVLTKMDEMVQSAVTRIRSPRKSPFRMMEVPPFIPVKTGRWALYPKHMPPLARGYFTGLHPCPPIVWMLKGGDTTWMSTAPMELESQAHHAIAAKGRVLIAGLGMGVLAYNVAKKPNVTSVDILERSSDVRAIVHTIAERFCSEEPGWAAYLDKVRVLKEDALKFKPVDTYDVAIFDIWPHLGDERLRPDTVRMATNIKAKEYASWGMELDFVTWCAYKGIKLHTDPPHTLWADYSKDIGVPLIMRNRKRMVSFAVEAARSTYLG